MLGNKTGDALLCQAQVLVRAHRISRISLVLFLVATLTPFDTTGRVDLGRLRAHMLWLVAMGVDGFVPTAFDGELLYLSSREREAIHRTVIETSQGRPVYPCTWDPSPSTAAYLTDAATEQGAAGVLMPPPLLYALDASAVLDWYRRLHNRVNAPVLAYHHPKYLRTPITPQTYAQLRQQNWVAGLHDGSGDPYRLARLAKQHPNQLYAGGDGLLHRASAITGLCGVISVAGNVWPDLCIRVCQQGEPGLAAALHERRVGLTDVGYRRAYKAMLGMGSRFPLSELPQAARASLPPSEFIS